MSFLLKSRIFGSVSQILALAILFCLRQRDRLSRDEKRAQPAARANALRAWLILNVRQKMKPPSKLLLAGAAMIAALAVEFAALRLSSDQEARLTIMNHADKDITALTVKVSGQAFAL